MTLEKLRDAAAKRGDAKEVARLERLMQQMDDYRQSYGRAQRGEQP